MLASHYAPSTPVELVRAEDLGRRMRSHHEAGRRVGVHAVDLDHTSVSVSAPETVWLPAPESTEEFARKLYRTLRDNDDGTIDVLLVVAPAQDGLGDAIIDRLSKAAAPRP